jgi:hypothetical protein
MSIYLLECVWVPQLHGRGNLRGAPRGTPLSNPHVHSLLIKFEQVGEIPPVERPPDF